MALLTIKDNAADASSSTSTAQACNSTHSIKPSLNAHNSASKLEDAKQTFANPTTPWPLLSLMSPLPDSVFFYLFIYLIICNSVFLTSNVGVIQNFISFFTTWLIWRVVSGENVNPMNPPIFFPPHITHYITKQVVTIIVKLFVTLTLLLNTASPPIGILNSFIAFIL